MIKFIGCVMIISGFGAIGFKYAKMLSNRVKELKSLEKAVMILESEITYIYTPVPEAFTKIGEKVEGIVGVIFSNASKFLSDNTCEEVYESIKISANECKNNTYLEEKDLEILYDLSKVLGQWDIESHKSIFKLTKKNLDSQIVEATEKENKQGKMFKALGISFGICICILLL